MKRVVVGMSGGVDSSVSIILLQNKGYEVVGVTFRTTEDFNCTDAVKVAEKLNIEHHIMDIREDFNNTVIESFINDYKNGLTPNPCVLCNKKIKFKYLYKAMKEYNCDFLATGHYAKLEDGKLYKSVDLNKDQTYFLGLVSKDILDVTIFPLEGIDKTKVREIANEYGLINANKKDSFDVCFITDKFSLFMKERLSTRPGKVINIETGEVVGEHKGLMYYTTGQRRGLDIGGNQERLYVVGKNIDENILYVALGDNTEYLLSNSCIIQNVNFLINDRVYVCNAKFRYRSQEVPVTLEYLDNDEILVKFEKTKSVTPGQTCTLYIDDQCIGAGIIKSVYRDNKLI